MKEKETFYRGVIQFDRDGRGRLDHTSRLIALNEWTPDWESGAIVVTDRSHVIVASGNGTANFYFPERRP